MQLLHSFLASLIEKHNGLLPSCIILEKESVMKFFERVACMSWHVVQMVLSGCILLAVLVLIVVRPRGLNVAWPAGVGAVLTILAGLISLSTLRTIFNDTWDASATLIALFLLSEALESNGFFTWAALLLARYARGSGWLLYTLMLLLTTLVTALLANDGAVLMLTPIFARLLTKVYPKKTVVWIGFLFATGFFADAMSPLFVPSNLTNIIIADATHLEFVRVAAWMALPTLAAFVVGTLAFGLRFHRHIGTAYTTSVLEEPRTAIRDHTVFWIGWIVLLGLVVGYILGSRFGLPISLIAGTSALVMVLVVQVRQLRSTKKILFAAPWNILIYALSMFVVITSAFQLQILSFLTNPLRTYIAATDPLGALFAGGILAALSAVVNNLPATLIGVLVLRAAHNVNVLAVYAIILGVDIGPKFTPFGSLATLLWLDILKRNAVQISWGAYFRENWWVTLLVLAAAFAGLLATSLFLH